MDANANPPRVDLKVLVAGTGRAVRQTLAAARAARGVHPVAIAVEGRVPRRSRPWPVAQLDYEVALEHPGVEAVLLAGPPGWSKRAAMEAIAAGKHVLTPPPVSLDAAIEMTTAAERMGVRLASRFPMALAAPFAEALGRLDRGEIGRVERGRIEFDRNPSRDYLDGWRSDGSEPDGGALRHAAVPALDLARRIVGGIVKAEGLLRHGFPLPGGVESEAFGLFRGVDGAIVEVRAGWVEGEERLRIEIVGDAGSIVVDSKTWQVVTTLTSGARRTTRHHLARIADAAHIRFDGCSRVDIDELSAFASFVRGGQSRIATGWDAVYALEALQSIGRSTRDTVVAHSAEPAIRGPWLRTA